MHEKYISPRQFYGHRLQVRERRDGNGDVMRDADGKPLKDHALHRWGRLFQEYCCVALAKIEMNALRWYENHQDEIRADLYQNLADAVTTHDGQQQRVAAGKRVVLPSSFSGGPRDMAQRYHDGMAAVRKRGKPSFFITMTCNPKWDEITRELDEGEDSTDRPDLTARVFKLKLDQLCHELFTEGIFGRVAAYLHVIEFQKRGLPHAHILVVLHKDDVLHTVDDIDACVSAELPIAPESGDFASHDEYLIACDNYHDLVELIVSNLVHHDCEHNPNASCKEDGVCKGGFPKPFTTETTRSESQIYPIYRRRSPAQGGATYTMRNGREVDNRWVVPHSPYLAKKYKCHMNVRTAAPPTHGGCQAQRCTPCPRAPCSRARLRPRIASLCSFLGRWRSATQWVASSTYTNMFTRDRTARWSRRASWAM